MKIDVSQIKAGLSRESNTSETVVARGEEELSGDECRIISQRNRLATYNDLAIHVWIRIYVLRSRDLFARGSARLGSASRASFTMSCRFADLSAWLTCFFVSRMARLSDF